MSIIVSKGPLYICTCCDQLWYKHSVSLADNFRLSNPNVSECLLNKTSVDNKEWLCNTCKMHLKKNKVPPNNDDNNNDDNDNDGDDY